MRNKKSECKCGQIVCDTNRDYEHMMSAITVALRGMFLHINDCCDPRRDAPRLKSFHVYCEPSEDGHEISEGLICEFLDISAESMDAVLDRLNNPPKGDNVFQEFSEFLQQKNDIEVFHEWEYSGDVIVFRTGQKPKTKG